MKRFQQGMTLIELMIVVAIVGILAALAIPAYLDYAVRAKMAEGITFLDAARIGMAEYAQSEGEMPTTATSAGINTANIDLSYISRFSYDYTDVTTAAVIVIVTNIDTRVDGLGIRLDGSLDTDTGIVSWNCLPDGTMPAFLLPASCRD